MKKSYIVDFTMEFEYIETFEARKEVIRLRKFLMELGLMPLNVQPMTLFCDNSKVNIVVNNQKTTKRVNIMRASTIHYVR